MVMILIHYSHKNVQVKIKHIIFIIFFFTMLSNSAICSAGMGEYVITKLLDVATIKAVNTATNKEKLIKISGIKNTGLTCDSPLFIKSGDQLYIDPNTPDSSALVYLKKNNRFVNYSRYAVQNGFASTDLTSSDVNVSGLSELEWIARFQAAGNWRCMDFVKFYNMLERRFGVPDGVLYAIAMTESNYKGWPWPWSLNTISKPYRFDNRQEMYAAIQFLQKEGISFGVGPMQIEYSIHKDRFDSLWKSTSPLENVYAAITILLENYKRSKNWDKAVMNYHSYKEKYYGPYFKRFLRFYRKAIRQEVNSIIDNNIKLSAR